jgi:hypothetical protein
VIFFNPSVISIAWSFTTVIFVSFHLSTINPLDVVWQELNRTGCIQPIGAWFVNDFYMTVRYSNSLTYVVLNLANWTLRKFVLVGANLKQSWKRILHPLGSK